MLTYGLKRKTSVFCQSCWLLFGLRNLGPSAAALWLRWMTLALVPFYSTQTMETAFPTYKIIFH